MEEIPDNGVNHDLHLINDTSRTLEIYLIALFIGNIIVFFLLLSDTIFYVCCRVAVKMHVKRCSYCTDPMSTEMVCEQSKTMRVVNMFCRINEQWKVWLLVDLFRTPTVKKKMINGKLHLKVGEYYSGQVGEGVFGTVLIFACVSVILCTYIGNFIGDSFLKITPTCIHTGDFNITAACYASRPPENTTVAFYRINCTTWNENESFPHEFGLLFCFSFYFDLLKSMTEIVGMFGLQSLTAQVTLTIAGKVWRNNKCFKILIIMITFLVAITIVCYLGVLQFMLFTTILFWNKRQLIEPVLLQPSPLVISMSSFILSTVLLMSTNDSRKTRNVMSMLDTTPKHQSDCVTENRMKDGETTPLLTEESLQTQYQSVDGIHSESMHREDTTIVEIHPYTTEESLQTQYESVDGIHSESMQGEDTIIVEIHPHTTEESPRIQYRSVDGIHSEITQGEDTPLWRYTPTPQKWYALQENTMKELLEVCNTQQAEKMEIL